MSYYHKKCPNCGEKNLKNALRCKKCKEWFLIEDEKEKSYKEYLTYDNYDYGSVADESILKPIIYIVLLCIFFFYFFVNANTKTVYTITDSAILCHGTNNSSCYKKMKLLEPIEVYSFYKFKGYLKTKSGDYIKEKYVTKKDTKEYNQAKYKKYKEEKLTLKKEKGIVNNINFSKNNIKPNEKICGDLAYIVYYPQASPPKIGCLYVYDTYGQTPFWLQVKQVLNDGIIVSADNEGVYHYGFYNAKDIFIQTSKPFVDGQILQNKEIVKYTGTYKYITVLGAQRTIHKFYRYDKSAIKNYVDEFDLQKYGFIPRKTKPKVIVQEISTENKNYDASLTNTNIDYFQPYIKEVQRRIKMNWEPPKSKESKQVVVQFKVAKDGQLLSCTIHESSGDLNVDEAAINAINATAPFSPLPDEFKGNSVNIQFTFDYNIVGATGYH